MEWRFFYRAKWVEKGLPDRKFHAERSNTCLIGERDWEAYENLHFPTLRHEIQSYRNDVGRFLSYIIRCCGQLVTIGSANTNSCRDVILSDPMTFDFFFTFPTRKEAYLMEIVKKYERRNSELDRFSSFQDIHNNFVQLGIRSVFELNCIAFRLNKVGRN